MTSITDRPYRGDDDFWKVREFLAELFPLVPPRLSWDVRRWDGSNCHSTERGLPTDRAERTRIWEDAGGRIVAVAMHEGGRELHPQVHPGYRHLTDEVIAWAEAAAARLGDDRAFLHVWDSDLVLRQIAEARGYTQGDGWGIARVTRFGTWPLEEPRVPGDYKMRPTRAGDADDEAIAVLLNAAFGRTFHHAEEHRAFSLHAPSFRRDLDLVAVAPDGSFVSYAAACWDDTNRHAVFEPVCTHPEHRQRGLARALMLEGMRRARDLGALTIGVETGDMDPANALYDSLPFTEVYRGRYWAKDLEQ
jgi:ribosomal protein S18 acetylase RimI-like enzyme